MRFLHQLWPFARNWWGTFIGIISALYLSMKGAKPLLESWDWLLDRLIDYKVRDALETKIIRELSVQPGMAGRRQRADPLTIQQLSEMAGLSEKKVIASLKRLKRKGDAISERPGQWKSNVPSVC